MTVVNTLDLERRQVWQALRELVLAPVAGKAEVSRELGLSFSRARALPRLVDGSLTLRQLAAALSTDAPQATLIVDDLQEQGLVRREPHPQDGRAKLVLLTAAGREAAARFADIMGTPPPEITKLAPEELVELGRILTRMQVRD